MPRKNKNPGPSARRRKPDEASKHAEPAPVALLTPDKLRQLYSSMLRCRLIGEEVRSTLKEGSQVAIRRILERAEATTVGTIIDLGSADCVALRRGDLFSPFVLGMPLKEVLVQLYAQHSNSAPPLPSQPHPGVAPLMVSGTGGIASRLNISTGVALAYNRQNRAGVVIVFCGEDSTALSSWQEAMNFAVVHKLPIVHIVQDDLGNEPVSLRLHSDNNSQKNGPVAPTFVVDANDVVAVYRVAQEAVRRARQGHGPSIIACKSHRWPGYSGIAPAEHLPSVRGVREAAGPDPIAGIEAHLAQQGLWSEAWKEKLVTAFRKQLQTAIGLVEKQMAKKAAG